MRTNKRAVGIIIRGNKLLVFHRFKDGRWYYAFAGGGVEEDETEEVAVVREMKEELNINIKIDRLLFKQLVRRRPQDEEMEHFFFLITKFSGTPELSGPEKERSSEDNQYHPIWITLDQLKKYDNLYPKEAKEKIIEFFDKI